MDETESKIGLLMEAIHHLIIAHKLGKDGHRQDEGEALRAAEAMLERARALL